MIYRLGDWTVDEAANRLVREAEEVRIEKRVMAVLSVLAAAKGEVVSKDALIDEVWNGAAVSDHSVANAISDLRRALGDDRRNPSYIETIPKRGYRLIAARSDVSVEPVAQQEKPSGERKFTAMIAVGFAVIAAMVFFFLARPAEPKRLYLADIENATGDADWSLAGEAGAEMLTVALAGGDYRLVRWRAENFDSATEVNARDRLLTGRIFLDGSTPMLALQLLDPDDGASIWADVYEFGAGQYGALSNDIVEDLKEPLGLEGLPAAYANADPEIVEDYWRARYLWSLREHGAIREGLRILNDVVARAPDYAPAHAAIADMYAHKTAEELDVERAETFPVAETHLARALALDPTLGEAFVTKAYLHFFRDRDSLAAMTAVMQAIDANSDNALAWQTKAMIESADGRARESLKSVARARALDPLSASMLWDEVWFYYVAGRADEALEAARAAREVSAPVDVYEALIHLERGDDASALSSWRKRAIARGLTERQLADIDRIASEEGEKAALAAIGKITLTETTYREHPVPLAALLIAVGEKEAAIALLSNARLPEKSWWWRWYDVIPAFDQIRGDPRLAGVPAQEDAG